MAALWLRSTTAPVELRGTSADGWSRGTLDYGVIARRQIVIPAVLVTVGTRIDLGPARLPGRIVGQCIGGRPCLRGIFRPLTAATRARELLVSMFQAMVRKHWQFVLRWIGVGGGFSSVFNSSCNRYRRPAGRLQIPRRAIGNARRGIGDARTVFWPVRACPCGLLTGQYLASLGYPIRPALIGQR